MALTYYDLCTTTTEASAQAWRALRMAKNEGERVGFNDPLLYLELARRIVLSTNNHIADVALEARQEADNEPF